MLVAIHHYLESHRLALRKTALSLRRAPLTTLLSVALITIALSLPGVLLVLSYNAQGMIAKLEQPATLSAYVAPHTSDATLEALGAQLAAMAGVAEVRLGSAQDSLNYFKQHYGMDESLALFDKNPFPAVIEITTAAEHRSGVALETLVFNIKQLKHLERVETNVIWFERMEVLIDFIHSVVWLLAVLFISAAVLMISNLMLTEIARRADEIKILSLLGATAIFIRRPFLYTACGYGLMGGLGATIVIVAVSTVVHTKLQALVSAYHGGTLADLNYFTMMVMTMAAAIFTCLLGTAIALLRQQRQLNKRL